MNPPYGGKLVDLIVDETRAAEMKADAKNRAELTLDERGLCDLEQLAGGGFSPLTGFLGRADYERVVAEGRLANGLLWPLPVNLAVTPGKGIEVGKILALRDVYGNLLAFLHIDDLYEYDKRAEALALHGTADAGHPAVALLNARPSHYAAGKLEVIRTPPHFDFVELRCTPNALRARLAERGWDKIVGFQTVDPIRRADEESVKLAADRIGGGLLIQPIVGVTKPGDVEHFARVRCHRALVDGYFDPSGVELNLLPLATRSAEARETLLRAIVARNHGCTDLILERDAKAAIEEDAKEIGVRLVEHPGLVYLLDEARFAPRNSVAEGTKTAELSDSEARDEYLAKGVPLPSWFHRPEVAEILRETHPPRHLQGLTIWFTGLSGSGKSTVAHALVERLAEHGRNVSMLDGDEIRTHLSKGLGFTKEDRDTNVNRVGYVAGLVARHGGTTLCSVISPYRAPRENARAASKGNFVEVYCATPIEVCESRDVKGLYARARNAAAEGKPTGFTGVDDPYEPPLNPEVTLDTSKMGVGECTDVIIAKLIALGYLVPKSRGIN